MAEETPSTAYSTECDDAVHVYYMKPASSDEKMKLMYQAHCARCWRPLKYNSKWPGPRKHQRPPFETGSADLTNPGNFATKPRLSIANCGHIFHSSCASASMPKCPTCLVHIETLRPFHFHTKILPTKPEETDNGESSSTSGKQMQPEEVKKMEDIHKMIEDIRRRMDRISGELSRLRKQVASEDKNKNNKPDTRPPWR